MHTTSVRHRVLHGLGALFYGQALIIVIQLAGVPILLHAWGVRLYGDWLILFAVPSYLSMADLGFSQSAANDMTMRYARGDNAGTLAVFQSLALLVYGAAALGLLVFTLLLWLLPLQRWCHLPGLPMNEVRWVVGLLAAEVLVKLADGVNHAGFRSHGEYGLHVALTYTTLFMQFSMIWAVALLGGGLLPAAAAFVLIRAAVTPGVAVWLLRRHRDLKLGLAHASRARLRALVKPALANITTPLALALNMQGMVLAVGATLGPIAVVTFVTLRTLSRLISQTAWRVSHAFEPELAAAWGEPDRGLLRNLFEHSMRAGFWLALPLLIGVLALGSRILGIWTHHKVAMDAGLFYWLLLSALTSVLWYGALNLLKSGNVHIRAALWYVLCAGGALLLAIALLHLTGTLSSTGIAMFLADALMVIYLWRAVARVLGVRPRELGRAMLDFRPLIRFLVERRMFHVTF